MANRTFMLGNYEYRTDIFQAIEQRLDYMTDRFCRTYVVRLDLTFPLRGSVAMRANADCSELMRQLKEYYTYHGVVTHYVGVREQNVSDNPHYHIALFFDGAKENNGWPVQSRAADIWGRILGSEAGGLVHLCVTEDRAGGTMIQKPRRRSVGQDLQNEQAAFDAARCSVIGWLTYLAKTETKGAAPPNTRELFCSRLPAD